LTGTDSDVIVEKVGNLLTNPHLYERMSKAHNPYGDGHAAARIVDVLINLAVERDTLLNQ
jgi:UDP-N-acetylglucosamine 2-epimerase (non-hydrolysing)